MEKTENKQIDILTIGDSSIDLHMKVDDKSVVEDQSDADKPKICFVHGTKIPVEEFEISTAGNALNVAVAASKLGLKTEIYTETGKDENSIKLIDDLKSMGVKTNLVKRNEGTPTDVHTIIVFNGERTIFSYHGKRQYKVQTWEKPKFIYYSSIGKGFESFQNELIEYINNNPEIGVVFNPGTFQLKAGNEHLMPFLAVTDVLILNKQEAEEISQYKGDLGTLHKNLQKCGPKLTVITDGDKGSSAFDGSSLITQKAYTDNRPLIDKTGAGDAFAAAFVSGLIYGKTIQECLKWGASESGSIIKVLGAKKGLLTVKEIETISSTL